MKINSWIAMSWSRGHRGQVVDNTKDLNCWIAVLSIAEAVSEVRIKMPELPRSQKPGCR